MHVGAGFGDSTGGGEGVTHSMSYSVAAAPMCPNRAI